MNRENQHYTEPPQTRHAPWNTKYSITRKGEILKYSGHNTDYHSTATRAGRGDPGLLKRLYVHVIFLHLRDILLTLQYGSEIGNGTITVTIASHSLTPHHET